MLKQTISFLRKFMDLILMTKDSISGNRNQLLVLFNLELQLLNQLLVDSEQKRLVSILEELLQKQRSNQKSLIMKPKKDMIMSCLRDTRFYL